ncbi:unnamed protein product, partial [Brassica rapa subsp. narinosa]
DDHSFHQRLESDSRTHQDLHVGVRNQIITTTTSVANFPEKMKTQLLG